jgi:hypothetical protein
MALDDAHHGELSVREWNGRWAIKDPFHRTFSYAYALESDALAIASKLEETWEADRVNWHREDGQMEAALGWSTRGTACDSGGLRGEAFFVCRVLRRRPVDLVLTVLDNGGGVQHESSAP